MPRSTRRSAAAAAAAAAEEEEEDAEPQSPALLLPVPVVDISGLKEDLGKSTFLQSVIYHGFMREDMAKDMYQQLTDADSDEGYQDFVASINEPLTFLHLTLKRMKYNLDDEWYIAFVNELPDEPSQSATTLSVPQRAYFQSLNKLAMPFLFLSQGQTSSAVNFLAQEQIGTAVQLEAIATSEDCDDGKPWVRSTDAVNLNLTQASFTQATQEGAGSQAMSAKLTHVQKEETLKQLVKEGWLAPTPDKRGCYSIGIRTFLELGQYLTDLDLPETTRNIWKNFV